MLSLGAINVALLVGLVLTLSDRQVSNALGEDRIIHSLVWNIVERRTLSTDYAAYPGERASEQWRLAHDRITENLASHALQAPEEQRLIRELRKDNDNIEATFSALSGFLEGSGTSGQTSATTRELAGRLNTQLAVTSQRMISGALALSALSADNIADARMRGILLHGIALLCMVGYVALVLLIFRRNVIRPLSQLQEGTTVIAQGNLDYRVDIRGKNSEFGQLARSFNEMAATLKASRTSVEIEKNKDEAMLASIGDGLIAVDEKGTIMQVSKAAERMLRWKADELIGARMVDVVPIEDEKGNAILEDKRPMAQAMTADFSTATGPAYYYVRQDKTRFPVVVTAAPVVLEGRTIGVIEVFRDATEEKALEKARMDFLSLASHQLRTPLSGTKWLIETIQRGVVGAVNQKQKEYLEQIHAINERMIKLAYDMLGALRLESGGSMLKKETISIPRLYKDLSSMMESAAKNHEVALRNNVQDHDARTIETDLQMLRGILECFVSNAINYSSPGQEVLLDVKEETTAMVFLVQDKGIGIPKEEQKRIFERFYRGSNAKAMKPDGTGLGLYIAVMLAEKIGGKVLFDTEEGAGSTFYLRIPKKIG